jgi:hypothetical protein
MHQKISVADPGSGAFLTPGSEIVFPEPGCRIPDPKPIFGELSDNKKFHNSLKINPNFFFHHFKNKIIFNFVKFVVTKKLPYDNNFFSPLSFVALFGSRIQDPRSGMGKNQDPG